MDKHIIEPFVQSGNTLEKIVLAMSKHMDQRGQPCAFYRHIWFDLVEPHLEVDIWQTFNPLFLTNCQLKKTGQRQLIQNQVHTVAQNVRSAC